MKAKERVTLVLACNVTGTNKVPVAVIGKSARPLCFRPDGCESPLPYFSQKNSWMDGTVFKRWVEEVFLQHVRAFTDEKVALIVDNLASHADIDDPQLVLICLPPNSTALFQPLDAGAIQALKGRYKRRHLLYTVAFLDGTSEAGAVSRARAAVESTG
eukprot:contig_20994_g5146